MDPASPTSGVRWSRILRFLRPYRGTLSGIFALTIVLSVLSMLPPLIMKAVIDRVLTAGDASLFFALGIAMVAVPVLAALARYVQTLGIAYVGQRFVFDVRTALYDHLLQLSIRFYGKQSAGKLVNRLMGDTGVVQYMMTAQSINVISDLVCAAFAISATFMISGRLAILLYLIVLVFLWNYRFNIRRIRQHSRGYQGAMDRLAGNVQNRLSAAVAVKTFGAEGREQGEFATESASSLGLSEAAQLASNTFSMNTQLIQDIGRIVLYFLGCALVLSGELTYGAVIAFTTYAMQLLGPAVNFSELARQIQDVRIAVERIFELYGELPEIRDAPEPVETPRLAGRVDFEQVDFRYTADVPVLQSFTLRVAAGETVALIGPTGCGKSTLLSLLMRFFDVTGGRVLLDGTDIRQFRVKSLRQQFGVVLQEPLLFSCSIAENIRYSRPAATQSEIEEAARAAEIHEFILTLPHGYETVLGMEGVDVSLGQRQRITIARALVAAPAILIMDEATSALDSESERAIQRAMTRILRNRTAFIVAHRLSTIRHANRIVLLERGRIAEMGRHDQLMAIPHGRYRALYLKHRGAGVMGDA